MPNANPVPHHIPVGETLGSIDVSTQVASYAPILDYLSKLSMSAATTVQEGKDIDFLNLHFAQINNRLAAAGCSSRINNVGLTHADFQQFSDLLIYCDSMTKGVIQYVADLIGADSSNAQAIVNCIINTYGINHSLDGIGKDLISLLVLGGLSILAITVPEVGVALLVNSAIEALSGYDIVANLVAGNFDTRTWEQDAIGYRLFNGLLAICGAKALKTGLSANDIDSMIDDLAISTGTSRTQLLQLTEELSKDRHFIDKLTKTLNLIEGTVNNPAKSVVAINTANVSMVQWTKDHGYYYTPIPQGALDVAKQNLHITSVKLDFPNQFNDILTGQGTKITDFKIPGAPSNSNLWVTNGEPKIVYSVGDDGSKLVLGLASK